MARWLLNSAVIPAGCYGSYEYREASKEELKNFLFSLQWPPVQSRIGYKETAEKILEWTGYRPLICREASPLAPGDIAMVVRLKYRVQNPESKGAPLGVKDEDWEIGRLVYRG